MASKQESSTPILCSARPIDLASIVRSGKLKLTTEQVAADLLQFLNDRLHG